MSAADIFERWAAEARDLASQGDAAYWHAIARQIDQWRSYLPESPPGAARAEASPPPSVPAPGGHPDITRWRGEHPWSRQRALPRSEYRGAKTEAT